MSKYRNIFGELEYSVKADNGDTFRVTRVKCGKYTVTRYNPAACVVYRAARMPLWDIVPIFDSWIQAVKFLKENINDLF